MKIIIKLIIAALLFGCLLKVPYGYFQFVRIAGCIGFCYLAYSRFHDGKALTGIFCVACAILLNPVFKIYFTRNVWNDIDVIIAILLLVWVIIDVITEGKRAYDLSHLR